MRTKLHQEVWASRLALELSFPNGVSVTSLSNDPATTESATTKAFLLGSIVAGRLRRAVFQVACPRGQSGDQLALDMMLTYERNGKECAVSLNARLDYAPSDYVKDQERNLEVPGIVAGVWQARLAREITRINIARSEEALNHIVRGEFTYLERYCSGLANEKDLVRNVDTLIHRARRPINELYRKEIALATTKTLRGDVDRRSAVRDSWDSYIDR